MAPWGHDINNPDILPGPSLLYDVNGGDLIMNQEEKEVYALWRFGLIAPAIHHNHGFKNNAEFFRHLSAQPLKDPLSGKLRCYSSRTFACWFHRYKNMGLDGLLPGDRKDAGLFRALSPQAQERIDAVLSEFPRIHNTRLRKMLKSEGTIDDSVSQSTIDRYVRARSHEKKLPGIHAQKDRKAFEFMYANECWQADTTELHRINGRRVCLMLIIDDASRMITGYGFFYHDNSANFVKVLKKAVSVYGIPRKLYMDNGGPYDNHQLQMICAKAGIVCSHAPVRDGAAKGKIERFNRTVKADWLEAIHWEEFCDLSDAENSFIGYLYPEYINKPHSALPVVDGKHLSPRERFLQDSEMIRYFPQEKADEIFLWRFDRKVKTDSTLQIHNSVYEVPSDYMKEKVQVFLDPCDDKQAWIEDPYTKERIRIKKLDRNENAYAPRKQHIHYPKEEA